MNNVYFSKNNKLQTRNRSGMIRSYRTTRTYAEVLIMILDMILGAFDRGLDLVARPAVCRVLRVIGAVGCIIAFLCLIGAVESQSISIIMAMLAALVLVVIEVLCLRGK